MKAVLKKNTIVLFFSFTVPKMTMLNIIEIIFYFTIRYLPIWNLRWFITSKITLSKLLKKFTTKI